ncbi:hypothetical protein DdX_22417 [Ditylenchus destructor]|uniref:Uncharacterized protein n=1 Tax=Ditylenchus destructor TaxID=166010 RepID=A0AAD4ME45_9BILA|nr:hypothetical protein DdX_22417 [Ditylenchus destructor]
MSSQNKETVLRQKRPNDENESIAEVGTKQSRIQKANESILPPRLFETFYMFKASYNVAKDTRQYKDQEMQCFERCKSVRIGSKPTNFTGRTEIYSEDNSAQEIVLKIDVSNDKDLPYDRYENIFSCMFKNEITDESWPHIQHFFSHLLEPHGTVKYVRLIPFDMKIWNELKNSNPNVVGRICAVVLKIEFKPLELDWVTNFSSKYCSAKTLQWWFVFVDAEKTDSNESDSNASKSNNKSLILSEECLDAIVAFVGSQGNNFDKLDIISYGSYNVDELAVKMVEMFQKHENPSKIIKEILLSHVDEEGPHYQVLKGLCFIRKYKNQNSDYVLETTQSVDKYNRTIHFNVIEPTL